jgi:hypothetical protein
MKLSVDDARRLPHLREQQPERRVVSSENDDGLERATSAGWKMPVGDDLDRLRGLPAIGRNVSGAMAGSDPSRALLAKERRRGRQLG